MDKPSRFYVSRNHGESFKSKNHATADEDDGGSIVLGVAARVTVPKKYNFPLKSTDC